MCVFCGWHPDRGQLIWGAPLLCRVHHRPPARRLRRPPSAAAPCLLLAARSSVCVQYLVSGEKWEGLDPLVRSRLLLAPLFLRRRDRAEMALALARLAAAGAADK